MITEAMSAGELPESLRQGDIILLYKKGDPEEIRNYRPITLLNVDYKIFSRIITNRLKQAVRETTHAAQLGFVPGRIIQEGTHLLKLLQAALDESNEEGIIVAADWEKAFDRASWKYIHDAAEALGFGKYMRGALSTMYNDEAPPERRIKVNGMRSATFTIHSGVPQGCPSSPLVFLLVTEALTRAVMEDERIEGVQAGGAEHRITQFADDTQFILKGYSSMPRLWELLKEYQDATGMRANVNKFEGLRMGRLKGVTPPPNPEYRTAEIAWSKPGKYVRILGIPFWEGKDYDPREFWIERYDKMKAVLARWPNLGALSLVGRRNIANSMVMGRFRYYIQSMEIPTDIVEWIDSDVQPATAVGQGGRAPR